MKKTIKVVALIMAMLIFTQVCGCSKQEEKQSIPLTLENYQDYLDIVVSCNVTGDGVKEDGYAFLWYKDIECNAVISGVSSNFNYNNVVVEIQIVGEASAIYGSDSEISETITVTCNVAGGGSESVISTLRKATYQKGINASYDVISVSGSLTPTN